MRWTLKKTRRTPPTCQNDIEIVAFRVICEQVPSEIPTPPIIDDNPFNVQRTCRLGAPPRTRRTTAHCAALSYSSSNVLRVRCQTATTNHAGMSASTAEAVAHWTIKVVINVRTAITQVSLPYYNRKDPQQGSKQARDSILKLLTGMNNDMQPLNFRSVLKLNGDKDPYFPAAPAWSTLSGGNNPAHTCTPALLCEWLLEAVKCVPSVKGVEIYILEGATQTLVTLQEVRERNIVMTPVPYLPAANSFNAPNVGDTETALQRAQAGEATARAAEATAKAAEVAAKNQLNMQAAFIADLQKKQVDELKAVQEQLKAMATAKPARPLEKPYSLPHYWPSRQPKPPNPKAKPKPQPKP